MCTVSLASFPETSSGFILTSNRDEAGFRETLPPDYYLENGVRLLYPKDKKAGGTWVGLSSWKRLICLLNGGFDNHIKKLPYRLSRGLVVKELLVTPNLMDTLENYNLYNIEPFTIIAVEWKSELNFIEFVWDGHERHLKRLDKLSHLWSSSPLYSTEVKSLRAEWFSEFQHTSPITPAGLWEFHHTAGTGDKNNDVIMDRGFISTQSITQVIYDGKELKMIYEDLKSGEVVCEVMS